MKNSNIIATCICGKHDLNSQEHKALEFLLESNLIESEHSIEAWEDAIKAWEYALTVKEMRLRNVLKIHEILMHRLNPRIAGKIREVDVWVGGRMGMTPKKLKKELHKYFNGIEVLPGPNLVEDFCRISHVEFENIHPFEDGNGRTGRILYNWQRINYQLPIHVIHHGHEQQEYYRWFK